MWAPRRDDCLDGSDDYLRGQLIRALLNLEKPGLLPLPALDKGFLRGYLSLYLFNDRYFTTAIRQPVTPGH